MPKIVVAVRLEKDLINKLKKQAKKLDLNYSDMIRMALENELELDECPTCHRKL